MDNFLIAEAVGLFIVIGCLGGFLSGLLGIGGGLVYVPALFFGLSLFGFADEHSMHLALGTSLAMVMVTVASSARAYYKRGVIDMALVRAWGPYIVAGAIGGSFFAGMVTGDVLRKVFGMVTLLVAFYMAWPRRAESRVPGFLTLRVQKFLCVLIGGLAALIGVGGAMMTIPLMNAAGLRMQQATGTGTLLGFVLCVPGVAGYIATGWGASGLPPFSLGYVNVALVAFLVPLSILVAPAGVAVAMRLDRVVLRRFFAGFVFIVALRMLLS